jgi:DNA-binding Lrp family transcriptional regulator
MSTNATDPVFETTDIQLLAALQCDGRVSAERVGAVLGLSPRVVQRRLASMVADGAVRVLALPPLPSPDGSMLLDIRVLQGQVDALATALAQREDIFMVDVSVGGDRISAVALAALGTSRQLVMRQLPATPAVTAIEAETVLHVFSEARSWRVQALSAAQQKALTPPDPEPRDHELDDLDELDQELTQALAQDARQSAAALARRTGTAESTARRRVTALFDRGRLQTLVAVDHLRLGLAVDANLKISVLPADLDATGRSLAAHPAVHGVLATTGIANLRVSVWLKDLNHLYRFLTEDLGALHVGHVETMLVGRTVKRPGFAEYPQSRAS